MNSRRRYEVVAGIPFFVATASYMLGDWLLQAGVDGWANDANIDATRVRIGALLEVVNSIDVVGVGVALYAVLQSLS